MRRIMMMQRQLLLGRQLYSHESGNARANTGESNLHGRTPWESSNSGVTSTGMPSVAVNAFVRAGGITSYFVNHASTPARSPLASSVSNFSQTPAIAEGIAA